MNKINVFSAFDGMSCGQQALERAGIQVDKYFASEIDKHAITVTMVNYPNTIQLGSIVDVDCSKLPKIDLLIGGSPCQSFSFAGKRKGMSTKDEQEVLTLDHYMQLKSEGYEFEGQSYLFWEYMRILKEVNPTYFLLENVMMGEKWEKVLTNAIGVKPIMINSSLVSAQNRRRLYWTNIGMESDYFFGEMISTIQQPIDKGILLRDILENEVDQKYFLSDAMVARINRSNNGDRCMSVEDKSMTLAAGYYKQGRDNQYIPLSDIDESQKYSSIELASDDILCIGSTQKNATKYVNKSTPLTAAAGMGGGHVPLITDLEFKYKSDYPNDINGKKDTLRAQAGGILRGVGIIDTRRLRQISPYQGDTLHYEDEKMSTLSAQGENKLRGIGIVDSRRQMIIHDIPEIVSVRKYEVDIPSLQNTLKDHKKFTNQEISDQLGVPKTMVEHWFRTDKYFSIPSSDIWIKLKELLEITTNEFDESVMTFEQRDGVFDKTNRVYDEDGISPTLTSTGDSERILVRKIIQLNESTESMGRVAFQHNRLYDTNGISPCLGVDARSPDMMEKSPCLHGFEHGTNGQLNKQLARGGMIRRLTPVECERLQTVKDNYTNHVSDSQRYKMLGNGWTVDVIAHIFSYLPK